jgi:hypothetical protein
LGIWSRRKAAFTRFAQRLSGAISAAAKVPAQGFLRNHAQGEFARLALDMRRKAEGC